MEGCGFVYCLLLLLPSLKKKERKNKSSSLLDFPFDSVSCLDLLIQWFSDPDTGSWGFFGVHTSVSVSPMS